MKFSTRIDTEQPADRLFGQIADFDRLERVLIRRGASVARLDPANGIGWTIGFDWRGRARKLRLDVTRFDRPERMTMAGQSEALDVTIDLTVVALSRTRSRLIFETDLRPRTMKARLMVQTAKLGKSQLDRRFDTRIRALLAEMTGTGA